MVKQLKNYYDLLTHRFQSFQVREHDDLEQCYALRKRVFGEELQRNAEGINFSPGNSDVLDNYSEWIATRDTKTNKIVAACRITSAAVVNDHKQLRDDYRLDVVPDELLRYSVVVSRLSLPHEYRKTAVQASITARIYEAMLENNNLLSFCLCEPGLYQFYRHFGYRPMAGIHQSDYGGFRAPLLLIVHDYERLKYVNSPFYVVAKRHHFPKCDTGLDWYQQKYLKNLSRDIDPDDLHYEDTSIEKISLMQGLSEKSVASLQKNSIRIKPKVGDYVFKAGAKDRHIGFVKQGGLDMYVAGKKVHTVSAGDVFGEIAYILNIPRSVDLVVAKPNTEIVLFSISCLNRVKDSRDLMLFWQNFSRMLALKVLYMNHKYASSLSPTDKENFDLKHWLAKKQEINK